MIIYVCEIINDCGRSCSDKNDDNDAKVVELVTECWIEPQHGVISECPPIRKYMSNLQYHQLPDAVSYS